jgi:hypothetical protein
MPMTSTLTELLLAASMFHDQRQRPIEDSRMSNPAARAERYKTRCPTHT